MIGGARKKGEKRKKPRRCCGVVEGKEGGREREEGMAHLEEKESGADRGMRGLADAPCIAV